VALVAAAGLAVAGCGAQAGRPAAGGGPPMAIAMMGVASLTSSAAARRDAAPHAASRAVRRTPALPANAPRGVETTPTPAEPRRPRTPQPSRPVALAGAERLGAPACATYADALTGRFAHGLAARGPGRALALVAESVASALLGLPVVAPRASLPARRRLDAALARLSAALEAADDGAAAATAVAMAPRIRAYAAALGIGACA
jgi:hypothetical protein